MCVSAALVCQSTSLAIKLLEMVLTSFLFCVKGIYNALSALAARLSSSSDKRLIIMLSRLSLIKLPLLFGMGAPLRVPIPHIKVLKLASFLFLKYGLALGSIPSVTKIISPVCLSLSCNSFSAKSNAISGLLPVLGIMPGDKLSSKLIMVRLSSVSGVTICASPA